MGRPLAKRFFGNENTGSASTTADDGIGGEGIASISTANVGSININNTYKTFPSLVVAAPNLPTGVTATTLVTWEVDTVSISGGASYTAGTITSITGLDGYATSAGNRTRFTVTVNGGGAPTFSAFTNRGEYTSIDGTGITTWAVVGPAGDGNAQATVKFRIKSIAIVEPGSGYTSVPSLSWSQTNGGTMPNSQTPSLTTGSGTPYTANAFATIICTAKTTSGGSARTGDIVSQKGSRRYKVKTSDGTAVCNLVAASPAVNEMTIIAQDYSGNTYYVTKLTRHRALLTRNTGSTHEFATGSSAAWTLTTLVAGDTGVTVQIANA